MITEFILNKEYILKQYGLPFFYNGMFVTIKNEGYEVLGSRYDADLNEQFVILKKLK